MTVVGSIVGLAYAASEGETHAATQAGGDAAHGSARGPFPPFDPAHFVSQLLWLALTFGAFYLLMSRVAIPRIASILEVRRDRISRDLDEAQRLKDESDAALAAYEHELAQARANAQAIANKAQDQMRVEADAERARLEAELAGKIGEAEKRIGAIRAKALGEVDRIANETAGTIVRELVGINPSQTELAGAVASAKGK